jgi:hypothetical protein
MLCHTYEEDTALLLLILFDMPIYLSSYLLTLLELAGNLNNFSQWWYREPYQLSLYSIAACGAFLCASLMMVESLP